MSQGAGGRVDEPGLDIPPAWEKLSLDALRGVVLIIGAPNAGKSTFARYLYRRLNEIGARAAFLDGDPGQSNLGPPATMTLACPLDGQASYPPQRERLRRFIGSTTPIRHMPVMLAGAARLVRAAFERGVEAVIYDTSGFIDPHRGGTSLKLATMELLEPSAVFALQEGDELEGFLRPLRRSKRFNIISLKTSPAARRRSASTRQNHRAEAFSRYFQGSRLLDLHWPDYALFPGPRFQPDRLVGLDDKLGFTLALGIVRQVDIQTRMLQLLTPLQAPEDVDMLRVGDLLVDPLTFRDRLIQREP